MYRKIDAENFNFLPGDRKIVLPEVTYIKDSSDIYTDVPIDGSEQSQLIASLSYRFEDLCDFLGIPRRLYRISYCDSPATSDGTLLKECRLRGYLVNLADVRNSYSHILFHAEDGPEDSNIVRGLIIDDDGNIECYSSSPLNSDDDYTRLPLTPHSAWLWATCPVKGADRFPVMPDYVELLNQAFLQETLAKISEIGSAVSNPGCDACHAIGFKFVSPIEF